MKPKQKHKRGSQRYSLDFYTPLTHDECLDRLKTARKNKSFTVTNNGNKFVVKKRGFYHIKKFRGHLEPYVAGTHVYGNGRVVSNYRMSRFKIRLFFMLFFTLLFLISLLVLRFELARIILIIGVVITEATVSFLTRDTGEASDLLLWITEQLNVEEVADETQTEA